MKISRKLQQQVENKIRHHLATGLLPVIKRESGNGTEPKSKPDGAQEK